MRPLTHVSRASWSASKQVRELTRGVLGHPKRLVLDSSAEASLGMRLRGHERMFPDWNSSDS
jgi:hypothetical protein